MIASAMMEGMLPCSEIKQTELKDGNLFKECFSYFSSHSISDAKVEYATIKKGKK
jgi:hypothetical protein